MTATALQCPVCQGPMWDETKSKYYDPSKNRPIAKCRDKACSGVIWPPKGQSNGQTQPATKPIATSGKQPYEIGPRIPQIDGWIDTAKLDRLFALYGVCLAEAIQQAQKLNAADFGCPPETVAAMTSTLFIQAAKLS